MGENDIELTKMKTNIVDGPIRKKQVSRRSKRIESNLVEPKMDAVES